MKKEAEEKQGETPEKGSEKQAKEKEEKEARKSEKREKAREEDSKKNARERAAEAKERESQAREERKAKASEKKEKTEEEGSGKRVMEKGEEPRARKPERARKKPKRPAKKRADFREFVELKPAEIVEAVVHLANEGHSQSEIGMILRDQYGIPKLGKVLGRKLGEILEEHKLLAKIPEDLMNLIRKSVVLREHLAKNRKDMSAKRGLMLTVSKIRRLERYYKKKGRLPLQWRYSAETAALLAK